MSLKTPGNLTSTDQNSLQGLEQFLPLTMQTQICMFQLFRRVVMIFFAYGLLATYQNTPMLRDQTPFPWTSHQQREEKACPFKANRSEALIELIVSSVATAMRVTRKVPPSLEALTLTRVKPCNSTTHLSIGFMARTKVKTFRIPSVASSWTTPKSKWRRCPTIS